MSQRTPKFHTLALDIGGVFWLGKADNDFFERWSQQANLDFDTLKQSLWFGPDIEMANIGAITAETYFERTATRLKIGADTVRAMIEEAFVGQVNDELASYIRPLKRRVRVTALTNSWSFARHLLERHGILDLFEVIVSSAEVGVKKPNPGIFQAMLDQLDGTAAGVIFVDDTLENIEAAQTFGIHCIHFQSTNQTISELSQLIG
jgi:putative hydrolase of the HAD superfamily